MSACPRLSTMPEPDRGASEVGSITAPTARRMTPRTITPTVIMTPLPIPFAIIFRSPRGRRRPYGVKHESEVQPPNRVPQEVREYGLIAYERRQVRQERPDSAEDHVVKPR